MCQAEELSPAAGNALTVICGLEAESPQRKDKQQDAKDVNEFVCLVADHDCNLRTPRVIDLKIQKPNCLSTS